MPRYRVPGPLGLRNQSFSASPMIQQKQTVSQSVRAAAAASGESTAASDTIAKQSASAESSDLPKKIRFSSR